MNQKPCQFYSFLQAVRGNWRNALFIRCSGSLCPIIRQASCEGFLMAADAGCQPIFLSVQTVRKQMCIRDSLWPVATHALTGALLGFCIPLAAALATNGTGLGGGDIKFCGILGLVYGPSGMALVFLTAAVTAMPVIFLPVSYTHLSDHLRDPFWMCVARPDISLLPSPAVS